MQVSSPGRAPPAQKWLKMGRGKFSSPKNSPPLIQKMKAHGIPWFSILRSPFLHICYSILRYYSSSTSKYLILRLSSFPLTYFGALSYMYLLKNVRDLSLNCCLFLLSLRVVGNGLRPKLYSEKIGHATLPPFPLYSCLNMQPPSAR